MRVDRGSPLCPRWPAPRRAAPLRQGPRRTHPHRVVFDFVTLLPPDEPTHYHRRTATIAISQGWWQTRSAEARWVLVTEAIAEHLCVWGVFSDPHAVAARLRQIPDLGARMAHVGLLRAEDGDWVDGLAATAELAG
jgi:hypothetical protein